MEKTFEENLQVIPLKEAIEFYQETYPNDKFLKIQLEYEGPFLKYEFVGIDKDERHIYEFNAYNKAVIKDKTRPAKKKHMDPAYVKRKALDTKNLMSLTEIDMIARETSPVKNSFQWELDRKKERTIWKVELANEDGSQIYEIKIDAHDGTIVQTKLKS